MLEQVDAVRRIEDHARPHEPPGEALIAGQARRLAHVTEANPARVPEQARCPDQARRSDQTRRLGQALCVSGP
ncbi:hypothetical protein GCM10022377_00620 [Zhihengliuella alba]|uniref:Uncharacterized protein n=1 Tax=Zhihengliuella alba TaxID=547018 RepID=A0ABP7CK38_9MICC